MKQFIVTLLTLIIGAVLARAFWVKKEEPVDPIQVIVTQLKTHAIIEHERQIAVWYRACPDVIGIDPQIFVAWPAKLSYEMDLAKVMIEREGNTLKVRTPLIHADEPAVPTDFLDYLATDTLFNFANEQQLVNQEIGKASVIARYLTTYYLARDPSLSADFSSELKALIERLAAALAVPVHAVEIEMPMAKYAFPKLPSLELCAGSTASVNGLPFARLEDKLIVPIGFKPMPSGRTKADDPSVAEAEPRPEAAQPKGIASVYGAAK